MHTKLAYVVSTLLAVGTFNVHAGTQAGRVTSMDCKPKAYQVVRDGKSIKMKMWLSLKNGDQIHLKSPTLTVKDNKRKKLTLADLPYSIQSPEQFKIKKTDCKSLFQQTDNQISVNTEAAVLKLKAANGRITLKWQDFPYTVSQTGQTATITSNLVDWGGKQLTSWGKKDIKKSVILITRGGYDVVRPNSIMLLGAKLVTGKRALFIGWQSGEAPYQLDIQPVGQAPIFSGIFDRRFVQASPLNLSKGEYEVVITDTQNQANSRYSFTVVAEHPAYPAELVNGSLMDEEMLATLKALWLAAQTTDGLNQPWLFEAYQLVAGIAEDYPPALMARDAILQRREIKRPPTQ